jgi:hypothetical protein
VDNATSKRPYDMDAPGLISALRPPKLNMDTYAQYFQYLFTLVLTAISGQARCSRATSL